MAKVIPVILAGGQGTRLWPLSTREKPKQFLALVDNNSLLQNTILRVRDINETIDPIVISSERYYDLVHKNLQEIDIDAYTLLLEPFEKNTAPAIAIAAMHLLTQYADPIMLVLPSDHVIRNVDVFLNTLMIAENMVLQNKLVTFGVMPDIPETGYGYIKVGARLDNKQVHNIVEFVEKPNVELATEYLRQGDYYWNSGMFMFRASVFLQELKLYAAEILDVCDNVVKQFNSNNSHAIFIDAETFAKCPSNSIDYAVMEHTQHGVMVSLDAGWSDVGSWLALWGVSTKDQDKNVLRGNVVVEKVQDSFVYNISDKKIVLKNVSDVVVVSTDTDTLIMNKN